MRRAEKGRERQRRAEKDMLVSGKCPENQYL